MLAVAFAVASLICAEVCVCDGRSAAPIAATVTAAPELASSLISAVFNIGIAAGAAIGSQALAGGVPLGGLPMIGAAFLSGASVLAVLATRGEGRGRG